MNTERKAQYLLAVDLGGTKVAVALMTQAGEIVLRNEEPTCQLGPTQGIHQIEELLKELMEQARLSSRDLLGIGVGIPAVLEVNTDFVIWAPNLNGWRDVPLRASLEESLGLPVYVEYDGHAAVLGEWWRGAGQGYRSVVMVIIGTGIGGGMILDGNLFRGRDRLAGAAGWFALTSDAYLEDQPAQSVGHWEALAAGPGIARRARGLLGEYPDSRLHEPLQIEKLNARLVFEAARLGDPLALRVVEETSNLLGIGIANIVSLVNPEIVILGGSVGVQGDLLMANINKVVKRWSQPTSAQAVKITTALLGSEAGLYGAAYAAMRRASGG